MNENKVACKVHTAPLMKKETKRDGVWDACRLVYVAGGGNLQGGKPKKIGWRARCTPPCRQRKGYKMVCGMHAALSSPCPSTLLILPSSQLLWSHHPTTLHIVRLGDVASFGLSGTGDVGLLGGIIGGW